MLLHNYLQRKSDIHSRAEAEYITLLEEITDPKMKEAVNDWEPGDKITDNYPQKDEKVEDKAPAETKATAAKPPTENISQTGAQTNHQPDPGQPQHEPAGDTAAV